MSLINELQTAISSDPSAIGLVEADALDSIRSPEIEQMASSRCLTSPTLNLLEWFYPAGGDKFAISTYAEAAHLAKQVPLYINAHENMSHKQQHTVTLAVSKVAEFAGKHADGAKLFCSVLDGYAEWPPALRAQVAYVLEKRAANTGEVKTSTAAVVCNPSALDENVERVIDPIFGAQLVKSSNKALDPKMSELMGVCAAGKFHIDTGAFKAMVQASNKMPIPSDGLGNRLLGGLISCIMPLSVPVEEKIQTLNEVAASMRPIKHSGRSVPSFKIEKDVKTIGGVGSSVSDAAEKPGTIDKLFRPKQTRQIARDYLLLRDNEGRVLFSTVEFNSAAKRPLAPKASAPQPLAIPSKKSDKVVDPTVSWFKTGGEHGNLVSGLIDSELLTPTGRCHTVGKDRFMEAKMSPKLEKMILPKASLKGFVKSLDGQFTMELKTLEDQEVFI